LTCHLSDVDLAEILSGSESGVLPETTTRHLLECAACRREVLAAIRMDGRGRLHTKAEPIWTEADEADFSSAILRGLGTTIQRAEPTDLGVRIIRLVEAALRGPISTVAGTEPDRLHDAVIPLAADSGNEEELPAFRLEQPPLLVKFRRVSSDGRIKAYVLTEDKSLYGKVALRIASRGISVTIPVEGVVDLPDLSVEDLRSSEILLKLQ
jgi:hypothetical protein